MQLFLSETSDQVDYRQSFALKDVPKFASKGQIHENFQASGDFAGNTFGKEQLVGCSSKLTIYR